MLSQSKYVISISNPWRVCLHCVGLSMLVFPLIVMPGAANALEIVDLTPDAANSLAPGFGTTLDSALNDPFLYNPLNPTSPRPNQAGAAGPHGDGPSGVDLYFSYTFTAGSITLAAGQEFVIDVYGRDDGCCTTRDDNYDLELYSGGIGGTLVASVTGLGLLNDPPAHVRTSLGSVGQTFDSFRLVAHDSELVADTMNYFLLQEIRAAVIDDAFTRIEINRQTGAMALLNNTSTNLNIIGYSLSSAAGAFDQSNWTTISGNYDALPINGGTGNGSVDVDDSWRVLTAASSNNDLSEAELDIDGGNGGFLNSGQPVDLGTPWRSTPFEDVVAKILLSDGSIETIPVVYNGTPIEVGNLDGVVGIGPADWAAFKAGQGADFSELSLAAAYLAGDLDGDGDHDLIDFGLFEEAYDQANGAGSFAAMLSGTNVPEPSGIALLGLGCLALMFERRRRVVLQCKETVRSNAPRKTILACVAALASLALATDSQAQMNVALGKPVIQSTNGFGFDGSLAVDGNRIGNSISHTDSGDLTPFLEVDLGQLTSIESINVATRDNCCTPEQIERDYNILVEIRDAADAVVYSSSIFNPWDGATNGAATDLGNGFVFEVDLIGNAVSGQKVRVSKTAAFSGSEWLHVAELEVFQEVSRLILDVNTLNGNLTLKNNTSTSIEFDSYQIISPGTAPSFVGSLDPSGWDSIAERATPIAGFPQGNGTGNGWEAGPNVSAHEFVEWYLDDELAPSSLASGASINLGTAYDTAVNGQDLELFFRSTDGSVIKGFVEYSSTGAVDGDYNGNGVVDAADYTVWRDNLGSSGLPNEGGISPGVVDQEDYSFWKSRFGATSGSGSGNAAAVPEPSSIGLVFAVCGGLVLRVRNRKKGTTAMFCQSGSKFVIRTALNVAVAAVVAWAVVGSTARAAVYNDRIYRLGDDSLEDAANAPGNVVGTGPGNVSTVGATLDSGESGDPTGSFLDLLPTGSPVYVDVSTVGSGRPGASSGNLGVQFDGIDDYLSGQPLDRPDSLAERLEPLVYPIDYTGITSRGVQMWAYVDSTKLALEGPQTLLMDSQIFGGPQITADGKWSQMNSQHSVDGTPFGGVPAEVDVVGDMWHHVMHHVYNANDPNAPVRVSGGAGTNHVAVLYVNGVAVSSNVDNLPADANLTANGFSGSLIVGAEDDGSGGFNNHFQGVLDDIKMYVFGNNETGIPGNLSDGEDWGTFDLFADNEWIAQTILDTVPGGVLKPGDVNKDGNVDGDDVDAFVLGWLSQNLQTGAHGTQTVGDWLTWEKGDMNHDGITDLADAFILHGGLLAAGQGGFDFGLLEGANNVPEPSTLALLGLAVSLIVLNRRRNKWSS